VLTPVALAFLTVTSLGAAQAPADARPVLFHDARPLVLRLSTDLRALTRDRDADRKEHDASLHYATAAGDTGSVKVAVRTRGIFRLKRCAFPPLRLDFPKSKVTGTPFAGQDKLKLVTHCRDARSPYEQNVLQEYALYRVFNAVTDRSYRARLARVTYVDTAKPDSMTRYGFLIESDDELATRLGVEVLAADNVTDTNIEDDVMTLVAVFQYLIGNTDWSVWKRHNIAVARGDNGALFALPYDFDFAGVIAAPYATPPAQLPIKSVRERWYRGFCQPDAILGAALARFRDAKDSIYAAIGAVPDLDPDERQDMVEYFDAFYRTIADPKAVQGEFVRHCRPRPT
jgi:hypothetical protein